MKIRIIIIATVIVMLMALPAMAKKGDGGLRFGAYGIGIDYTKVDNTDFEVDGDDTDYEETITYTDINFGLPNSYGFYGLLIGYEIAGNHEVGGNLGLNRTSQKMEWSNGEDGDSKSTLTALRMGGYYNYNFHVNKAIDPFVGAFMNLDYRKTDFDGEGDAGDSTTTEKAVLMGPEGGIKIHVYKHVSLDVTGRIGYAILADGKTEYDNYDAEWKTKVLHVGMTAGVSLWVF